MDPEIGIAATGIGIGSGAGGGAIAMVTVTKTVTYISFLCFTSHTLFNYNCRGFEPGEDKSSFRFDRYPRVYLKREACFH